jgi:predicted AAA+ superfamily ATPase
MFKADLAWADIQSLDEQLRVYGSSQLADEQLAFVIVASVPEHVQHALFQRAEEKGKLQPAIIPISQSEIETGQSALSTLREVLDRWLYRRDLFAVNFPVSGRRFFGRGKPLAEIREAIASGSPAGVFGLRKVGKTSLLQETERRARENGDIVVYLDLLRLPADIKDMRWIYWKIGNELFNQITSSPIKGLTWRLGGKFRDFLDVPKDYEVGTRFDADITKILTALKTAPLHPRPKIVLLFDEVERLLPNRLGKEGLSGFFDFFSYFRGVAQESNDFVLIVTAANASIAEAAQFDGRDNPVFNFFREIYLPLLEPTECATMLSTLGRGMGIRFDDQALQDIYRLTGGHPFLSRQLASFVALRYRTRPLHITSKMIDDAINEYLEFSGEDFSEILERLRRDYPEELTVFLSIANAARGVPIEEVRQAKNNANLTIKHLVGYQLVKVDNNRIEPTIGLMSRWLSKTGYLHTGTL